MENGTAKYCNTCRNIFPHTAGEDCPICGEGFTLKDWEGEDAWDSVVFTCPPAANNWVTGILFVLAACLLGFIFYALLGAE